MAVAFPSTGSSEDPLSPKNQCIRSADHPKGGRHCPLSPLPYRERSRDLLEFNGSHLPSATRAPRAQTCLALQREDSSGGLWSWLERQRATSSSRSSGILRMPIRVLWPDASPAIRVNRLKRLRRPTPESPTIPACIGWHLTIEFYPELLPLFPGNPSAERFCRFFPTFWPGSF